MHHSPPILIGVTGTNGKTSVTTMLASLLRQLGIPAAAIGQRIETPEGVRDRSEVPPGDEGLPAYINYLCAEQGVKVIAIEVYSAALAKGLHNRLRYDGIAFTNITEDHLNVHGNMQAYIDAKLHLFNLVEQDACLVFDPDSDGLLPVQQASVNRSFKHLIPEPCETPFLLQFQQGNCYMAVTLAKEVIKLLNARRDIRQITDASIAAKTMQLVSPPGRYEQWLLPNGVLVIVDFAHNPGGIRAVIDHTRAMLKENHKLAFLLSSKGGWGATKREAMADAAANADLVVVSDDDPRKEDPAVIRAQLAHAHNYKEIAPRNRAIYFLSTVLQKGDVAIIAGRGADTRWEGPVGRHFYSDIDVLNQLGAKRA